MGEIRKFAFDTEFAADGVIVREGAQVAKRLTQEEIEAARAAAYESGKSDALAHAEREAATALEAIADAASAILNRLGAESRAMREEAAHIARIAARKIAGAALNSFGAENAAAAIEAAMDTLRHQPRLVVKLSPDAAEVLRPRIDKMSETHGYGGAILVRAEPGIGAGEVSIDWSDGVITLDPKDAAQRLDDLIEAALASSVNAL